MDIGFGAPVSGAWATPRNLTEFARRAERLRDRALWTFPRLAAPTSAALAPAYRSVLDPLVSLGYLAAVTTSIRLGVAVVNHPFASPLLLAKQAATVDVLCGGRGGRAGRAEGYVAALRALWSTDRGYHGSFFDIPPGRRDPPPVQRPGPAVLLGGLSWG